MNAQMKEPYFVVNNGPADVVIQDAAHWNGSEYVGFYSHDTLEQFKERCGPNVSIMEFDEAYKLYEAAQAAKYKGPVKEIDEERYSYLLECLPPVNWVRMNGSESFKFMERISGDITYIVVRTGGRYYEFNDSIHMSHEAIMEKVSKAIADGSIVKA